MEKEMLITIACDNVLMICCNDNVFRIELKIGYRYDNLLPLKAVGPTFCKTNCRF